MTADHQQVVDTALSLPEEVRAALAEQLLASLEAGLDQSKFDVAWAIEAEARIDAYEQGALRTVAAEEVFRSLRLDAGR